MTSFPFDAYRWAGSIKNRRLAFLSKVDDKARVAGVTLPVLGSDEAAADIYAHDFYSEHDWSKGLTFTWRIMRRDGSVFFGADENNNEKFNLYRVDPATGVAKKLTNVEYLPDYGFSPDETKVAYTERMGPEGSRVKVHVLDLVTGEDKVVASDTAEQQFTWNELSWRPDGSGLVLTTLTGGDRTKGNLSYVSTSGDESQRPQLLTDPAVSRTFPSATRFWLGADEVVVRSGETGVANYYRLNVVTKAMRPITALATNVAALGMADLAGKKTLVVSANTPLSGEIWLYDMSKAEPEGRLFYKAPLEIGLLDVEGSTALIRTKSANSPFAAQYLDLAQEAVTDAATLPEAVLEKIVKCRAEPVRFKTFDDIALTIEGTAYQGELHGMLYTPKEPLPEGDRLGIVEAFYGGGNVFALDPQVLCDAGIYVFSPAPRGSSFFTEAFERANDGDLGGNEVIDVIHAARFLSECLGLPESRIGAYGHSHGGYEVMRQLTFPGEVNGVDARFDWGFGIAQSGFGSIKGQYDGGNIRQWIVKEAGDPAAPGVLERWEQRSPVNFVKELTGRLLLVHGTEDQRVPFSESVKMVQALEDAGLGERVMFQPLDGIGHAYETPEANATKFEAWFRHMEMVP
jgi:dipeptidyl aminopeptidase/acylaminoacyl peptidase